MPKPCGHDTLVAGCVRCHLYATSPKHREFWDANPTEIKVWVEELGRELSGKQLAIYLGKNEDGSKLDMPEHERLNIISTWKRQKRLQGKKKCNCKKH